MLKRVSIGDVHEAIYNKLKSKTDIKILDVVPENEPSPLIFIQFVGKEDNSTKTMYIEDFKFYIHALSEGGTSDHIYKLINEIEEILTEDIEICDYLVLQNEDGILQVLTEQTGEKHAILQYSFKICYGFKCKV